MNAKVKLWLRDYYIPRFIPVVTMYLVGINIFCWTLTIIDDGLTKGQWFLYSSERLLWAVGLSIFFVLASCWCEWLMPGHLLDYELRKKLRKGQSIRPK